MSLIEELKKEKAILEKRISTIDTLLKSYIGYDNNISVEKLDSQSYESSINGTNFPTNGTWLEQIIFIIKDRNRFLHNSEIAEALIPYYSNKDINKIKRRVSSVLSSALTKKTIPHLINFRFSNSRKDTVWGHKNWLNDNKEIMDEYKYINIRKNKYDNNIEF